MCGVGDFMRRWLVVFVVVLTLAVLGGANLWWRHIPVLSDAVLNHLHFGIASAGLRLVAALALTWLLTRKGLRFLGFAENPATALVFAIIATMPLWVPLLAFSHVAPNLDATDLLMGSGYFPLSEELFCRAFAFGLLYRVAGIGFWPSAVLSSVPFALGHLYQAHDMGSAAATLAITFLGALLLCWLYLRWNWNIWVPFALHALMNLWWSVFNVGEGAFAGWLPTAMQLGSAAAAIVLTLVWQPFHPEPSQAPETAS